MVSHTMPVSTCVMATRAPGMTAPVSSRTVPSTRDVSGCAAAGTAAANMIPATNAIAVLPPTRDACCKGILLNAVHGAAVSSRVFSDLYTHEIYSQRVT